MTFRIMGKRYRIRKNSGLYFIIELLKWTALAAVLATATIVFCGYEVYF